MALGGEFAGDAAVPLPDRLPRTELRRTIPPRNSGSVAVDAVLDDPTIVPERASPMSVGRGK